MIHDKDLARDVGAALREIEMLLGSLARQFAKAGFEYAPGDLQRTARELVNVQERISRRLKEGHLSDDGTHSSVNGDKRCLTAAGQVDTAAA